jgi:hypothetical protein
MRSSMVCLRRRYICINHLATRTRGDLILSVNLIKLFTDLSKLHEPGMLVFVAS